MDFVESAIHAKGVGQQICKQTKKSDKSCSLFRYSKKSTVKLQSKCNIHMCAELLY